jgi:hypothetical protein
MNVNEAVDKYLQVRALKEALEASHKEEMSRYNKVLQGMENMLLKLLNDQGAQHIATTFGTVYKKEKGSAKISDWDAFLDFVKQHHLWHMLPHRVVLSAVDEYQSENKGQIPPGVDLRREITVNVRSSRGETKS